MLAEQGAPWSDVEVDAIVAAYFDMLRSEMLDRPYSKLESNRQLQQLLGRTHGSIERKHQNISAVLVAMGARSINGYKPLPNVQGALREAVGAYWESHPEFAQLMEVVALASVPSLPIDVSWAQVDAPEIALSDDDRPRSRRPVRVNFAELEARARELGQRGEELVVRLERQRLQDLGEDRLARRVEHVSAQRGDGLGYDILSFDIDGRERYIEVKTTRGQIQTPFLATRNEVEFSREIPDAFYIYRLFRFDPPRKQYYVLPGSMDQTCELTQMVVQARPRRLPARPSQLP